jgi:hypothetical protein
MRRVNSLMLAKLKADAQKVVGIIKGDKAKNQIFCQIANLDEQIDQEKDRGKLRRCYKR